MLVSSALFLPSCEMRVRGLRVKSSPWNLRVQGAVTIYEGSLIFKTGCGIDTRYALTRDKPEMQPTWFNGVFITYVLRGGSLANHDQHKG